MRPKKALRERKKHLWKLFGAETWFSNDPTEANVLEACALTEKQVMPLCEFADCMWCKHSLLILNCSKKKTLEGNPTIIQLLISLCSKPWAGLIIKIAIRSIIHKFNTMKLNLNIWHVQTNTHFKQAPRDAWKIWREREREKLPAVVEEGRRENKRSCH